MRAVAQRVTSASVTVDAEIVGAIDVGLLVYVGVGKGDGDTDVSWMAQKLGRLRVFEDEHGKMSRAVKDVGGRILLVSQFTLYGDVRRGLRPSFDEAAPPAEAAALMESLKGRLEAQGISVATGRFRATMLVRGDVDGPVTILLDSKKPS